MKSVYCAVGALSWKGYTIHVRECSKQLNMTYHKTCKIWSSEPIQRKAEENPA